MELEDLYALGCVLASDETNMSNEAIIDASNLAHGVVVADVTSPYYNLYLLGA
jgi:hypothetical protein